MRTLLTLSMCTAIGAPGAALAQEVPASDLLPAPATTPPPAAPEVIPLPAQAERPPEGAGLAPALQTPPETTVAPVIVEGKEKDNGGVGRKIGVLAGTVAGGVVGGAAGAAVAGPIGKVAGGLVGKGLVRRVFGKDKPAQDAGAAASASQAAQPAAATVSPMEAAVSAPEAPTR